MDKTERNSVLIVDDEKTNIISLTHILSDEYNVHAAKNGHDAIEATKEFVPNIILLDILMPDMDGYEVLSRLKQSEDTKTIPVIFVTGLGNTEDEEKGLAMGACDYISKPFNPSIVRLRVKNQIQLLEQNKLIQQRIRQQAQMELLERSSRLKSEFTSRMNHEMLTPMNAIIGLTGIVKNSDDPAMTAMYLDKIEEASGKLLELIYDVLDVSKMEEGSLKLETGVFSFYDMINDLLKTIIPFTDKKKQKLTCNIDEKLKQPMRGDKKSLAKIIRNLLLNANKFTSDQGLIQLEAGAHCEKNEMKVTVVVSDNGIGIPLEKQSIIFQPFEQADGSLSREFHGAGLGLAISKYLVDLMGGSISFESEPDKGTKFYFTFKAEI